MPWPDFSTPYRASNSPFLLAHVHKSTKLYFYFIAIQSYNINIKMKLIRTAIFLIYSAYLTETKNPKILIVHKVIKSYLAHLKYSDPRCDEMLEISELEKRKMCEGLLDSLTYEVLKENYLVDVKAIGGLSKSVLPTEASNILTKKVEFELERAGHLQNTDMPAVLCFSEDDIEWLLIPVFNHPSPHHLVLKRHFLENNSQLYGIYYNKMDYIYVTEGKLRNREAEDCFLISQSALERMYEHGIMGERKAHKIDGKSPREKFNALNEFQFSFLCGLFRGAYSNATEADFRASFARKRFISTIYPSSIKKLKINGKLKYPIIDGRSCGTFIEGFYLVADLKEHFQIFLLERSGGGSDAGYELVAAMTGPNTKYIMHN